MYSCYNKTKKAVINSGLKEIYLFKGIWWNKLFWGQ